MGRKSWHENISGTEFSYLKLRCRAALAEAFATLSLTPHPWRENELAVIGEKIKLVVSLFHQYTKHQMPKIGLECIYKEGQTISWYSGKNIASKATSIKSLDNSFSINVFFPADGFNKDCKDFILGELKSQLSKGVPKLVYSRREDFENSPQSDKNPFTMDEKLWDLRVRMSDFLRRFLTIYEGEVEVDPFSVFFLKPKVRNNEFGEHIPSGLFGYKYHLDKGQTKYLNEIIEERIPSIHGIPSDMAVYFPSGMCSRVFLSGQPQDPHPAKYVLDQYEENSTNSDTKKIEKEVLDTSTMIEVPIYNPKDLNSTADGPDLIVSIRIPLLNKPFSGSNSGENDKEDKILPYIKSDEKGSFQNGESQIVMEACQKLTNVFLFARSYSIQSNMVYFSENMKRLMDKVKVFDNTDFNVLLLGNSGVGKSTVAERIHDQSRRASKNYTRISASAFTDELGLSQLFGHVKNAFTGAGSDKEGLLQSLNGGTLFLDDIDTLSPNIQAKLLSYLDTHEYYRLGDEDSKVACKANVRLICATNVSKEAIMNGKTSIRMDFYNRISTVTFTIHGLGDRDEDIKGLITFLIDKHYKEAGLNHAGDIVLDPTYIKAAGRKTWINGEIRALSKVVCCSMAYANHYKKPMDEDVFELIYADQYEMTRKLDKKWGK